MPALSPVTSVPRMTALPSTYLRLGAPGVGLGPQATVWVPGLSHWGSVYLSLVFQLFRLLQSSLLNSFMVALLTAEGSPAVVAAAELVALGLGVALAAGLAELLAWGLAVRP